MKQAAKQRAAADHTRRTYPDRPAHPRHHRHLQRRRLWRLRKRALTPRAAGALGDAAPPGGGGVPGLRFAPVPPGSDQRRPRPQGPGPIRSLRWRPAELMKRVAGEQVALESLLGELLMQESLLPEPLLPAHRAGADAPGVPPPAGSAPWPCCSRCGIRPRPAGRGGGRGPRAAPPESGGTWGGHWRRSDGWARPREIAGYEKVY